MSGENKYQNMWEPVFRSLESMYPYMTDQIVDWYPSGQMEITFKLKDGTRWTYCLMDSILAPVHDPKKYTEFEMDEREWRLAFAQRLHDKIRKMGISQDDLSMLTGISRVTISKYLNAKATPSGINIDRLAWALKCSSSELINFR